MGTGKLTPKGKEIQRLRAQLGSQLTLVKRIEGLADAGEDLATPTEKTIARIENGRAKSCFYATMVAISRGLGVPLTQIVEEELGPVRLPSTIASINVALVTSGNHNARIERVDSFKQNLNQLLALDGCTVRFSYCKNPDGRRSESVGEEDWRNALLASKDLIDKTDFVVTIGTVSSMMCRQYMGDAWGEKPTIFLGVTNPVAAGLVESMDQRDEPGNVTGITFGPTAAKVVSILNGLFPTRKLVFVYSTMFPQDEFFATELNHHPLIRESGRLVIRKTRSLPTAKVFDDEDAIYFSWFTLERMFDDPHALRILKSRNVVSTTRANAAEGAALAAIGPDETQLGRRGAELIAKLHGKEIETFGRVDVIASECFYWINTACAKRNSIALSRSALRGARELFE